MSNSPSLYAQTYGEYSTTINDNGRQYRLDIFETHAVITRLNPTYSNDHIGPYTDGWGWSMSDPNFNFSSSGPNWNPITVYPKIQAFNNRPESPLNWSGTSTARYRNSNGFDYNPVPSLMYLAPADCAALGMLDTNSDGICDCLDPDSDGDCGCRAPKVVSPFDGSCACPVGMNEVPDPLGGPSLCQCDGSTSVSDGAGGCDCIGGRVKQLDGTCDCPVGKHVGPTGDCVCSVGSILDGLGGCCPDLDDDGVCDCPSGQAVDPLVSGGCCPDPDGDGGCGCAHGTTLAPDGVSCCPDADGDGYCDAEPPDNDCCCCCPYPPTPDPVPDFQPPLVLSPDLGYVDAVDSPDMNSVNAKLSSYVSMPTLYAVPYPPFQLPLPVGNFTVHLTPPYGGPVDNGRLIVRLLLTLHVFYLALAYIFRVVRQY